MSHALKDSHPVRLPPGADGGPPPVTRRTLLTGAAGAAGLAAVGGGAIALERLGGGPSVHELPAAGSADGSPASFRSRPDLQPPRLRLSARPGGSSHLLLGPGSEADAVQQGPMILDPNGELVWFEPLPHGVWATNVTATSYRGEPALAWWHGKVIAPGFGQGEALIKDRSYRHIARVRAGNGRQMDLHELVLTGAGTALFTCYPTPVQADLTAVGGPADGRVQESVIQEVELHSGRVLLEWRSLDHIPVSDSYKPLGDPYDYLHVNSIQVAPDGNLLVSARHTWALYKLERRTGQVIWTLGGKRSDFAMGRGTKFSWQHDARVLSPRRISVFDDGSDGPQRTESQSRGLVIEVDEAGRAVTLARQYQHPRRLSASAMGSFQNLPGGGALIGWGTSPNVSEFGADGRLVWNAELPQHLYTYRAYRAPWEGRPHERPDVRIVPDRSSQGSTLYVSWNGGTGVSHWMVRRGSSADRMSVVGVAPRLGFETAISLSGGGYAAVSALDRSGRPLAHSRAVRA